MPLRAEDVRIDVGRTAGSDGSVQCWASVHVLGSALRPLGLHPDQPASRVNGPSPPAWWHAEAERSAGGW
ncbi:hypothetical protein AB0M28_12455 [Streptomyces sp. NPDC051940]|uniref:hypothetical protein n=1 Tax=Streptomyces sp. NPDC051940 TaxID=3155675 RepID=UPI0034383DDB